MENFLQDLRYSIRTLRLSPTFTGIAIGTLALGIGAAVGIFTVVNAVLLRPLPIRAPERVAVIYSQLLDSKSPTRIGASWTKFEVLRSRPTAFSDVAAYSERDLTIDPGSGPARIRGSRVSAGFFETLGLPPVLGRSFTAGDDADGAAPVVILTDAYWRNRLNADLTVVGKSIRIEGRDTAIIGVLPRDFHIRFTRGEPQVYLTSVFTPDVMTAVQIHSGAGFLTYFARLRDGATFQQASADLAAIDAQYKQQFGSYADSTQYALHAVPFLEDLVGELRPTLQILMGAVLLLLLIACANVAHLLLSRAVARQREVALRLALGASHARLVHQFLTEALLLALGGGALGIILAIVAVRTLVALGPSDIPRLADATPDLRVLAFAVFLAFLTAMVFGLIPALREGQAITQANRFRSRLQQWIATSETAVTVVLLIAATLLFRSLVTLQSVDPGFNPAQVIVVPIALQQNRYVQAFQREEFFTRVIHGIQAEPGISGVGASSYVPMAGGDFGFYFFIEGHPHLGVGRDSTTAVRHVSADYFRVMQIPLRRGRMFSDSDEAQSQPVAIINEKFAQTYFPNVDPIGQGVANSRDGKMREIVGIVGNVRFSGPASSFNPELFLPYRQEPWPLMTLVVSSSLPTDAVAGSVRRVVQQIDRDQAVAEIRAMPVVVAATTTQEQFTSSLVVAFALVATALAAVGLYGVVAVFVSQRGKEFGIRMALGAQRHQVLRLVMSHGVRLISTGAALGLIGAYAVSGLLSSMLFEIKPTEPESYVIGAAVLFITGLLACYLPARRATNVNPAQTLRAE